MHKAFRIFKAVSTTAALCAAVVFPAHADSLEQQRGLFKQVFSSVELGNWAAVTDLPADEQRLLESYALWPDLRATWYRATIRNADPASIELFLDTYGVLKPARDLRYRYALELARRGDLQGFHKVYVTFYQGLEIAKLDCLALQAELEAGRGDRIVVRAKDLWTVGKSQEETCDPVFDYLSDNGHFSARDYEARYALAIKAREFSLARWVGKSIDEAHVENARLWQRVQSKPEAFLRSHDKRQSTPVAREQLVYAAERLTFSDPDVAHTLWNTVARRYGFTVEQRIRTARHIALWTARDGLNDAYSRLVALPPAGHNDEVMRWRARTSLKEQNWPRLLADIEAMSDDERLTEEWQYWRAMALSHTGEPLTAKAEFASLSAERSYYGFLAADEINAGYSFEHAGLAADETLISALVARPELIRARELFLVGLDGRGRSEWDAIVRFLEPDQKAQAAILANRWGWHSRAISTVASLGEYDDLAIRYPLPFQTTFEQQASNASISATWAYGIARSESLFMRDVRSSAGAVGLMQLMPATGKDVAQQINLRYAGLDTLVDPQSNIRLGTAYLGEMAQRYDGNRVLATAAYNAGPHRVDRWRPDDGALDARIWIENIPFNETRSYVRRVMAAETIFYWRLNGRTQRLRESLPAVEASDSL